MAVLVTVSPTTATLNCPSTQVITPTVTGDADTTVTWSIVSGPGTVSTSGKYTTATEGTAVVRATSHADDTKHADCTITVKVGVVASIAKTDIIPGEKVAVTAVVSGSTGSTAVTWAVTGSGAISNGYYEAGVPGTDTITATSVEDSSVSNSFTVTVTATDVVAPAKNVHLPQAHNHYIQSLLADRIQHTDASSAEGTLARAAFDSLRLA